MPTITIKPFKRSEYDRGSRRIIVDSVVWGDFRMESHGVHGPSYHASDLQGSVYTGKRNPVETVFSWFLALPITMIGCLAMFVAAKTVSWIIEGFEE